MSPRNFAGSTVLVSGGGGGLGRAIAQRFARAGARVAVADRDADAARRVAAEIESAGGGAIGLACDVTDAGACTDAVRATAGRFGRLDALVNNAGLTHRSAFAKTDPAVIRRVVEVNFFGAVNLTHAALPELLSNRGAIAAISSVAGFSPLIARTGYAASKHAMHGFFGSLRSEIQPLGVDVTLVCPSFIDTAIDRNALGPDGRAARHAQVTVGGRMTPEYVAERIHAAMTRRKPLQLVGATAWQAWWVSRLAPSLYERIMARQLQGEMPDG